MDTQGSGQYVVGRGGRALRFLLILAVLGLVVDVALQLVAVGSQGRVWGQNGSYGARGGVQIALSQSVGVDRIFELVTADIGTVRHEVEVLTAQYEEGTNEEGKQRWASAQFANDLAKNIASLQEDYRSLQSVFASTALFLASSGAEEASEEPPSVLVVTEPGGHLVDLLRVFNADSNLFVVSEPCKSEGVDGKPVYDVECVELTQRWASCSPLPEDVVGLFRHSGLSQSHPRLARFTDLAKAIGGNLSLAALLTQFVSQDCRGSQGVVVGEVRMEYILADVIKPSTHVLHIVRDPRSTIAASQKLWDGLPLDVQASEVCRRTVLKMESGGDMNQAYMMLSFSGVKERITMIPMVYEWSGIQGPSQDALDELHRWTNSEETGDMGWAEMLTSEDVEKINNVDACQKVFVALAGSESKYNV